MSENKEQPTVDMKKRATLITFGLVAVSGVVYAFDKIATGYLSEVGKDFHRVTLGKRLAEVPNMPPDNAILKLERPEIVFGNDMKNSCIIPGDTNINLLAKNNGIPKMSEYIRFSNEKAEKIHEKITGIKSNIVCKPSDSRLRTDKFMNMLILGGPVANALTRDICKYGLDKTLTGKPIPKFRFAQSPIPYGFYVGNHNGFGWVENTEFKVLRPDIDKTGERQLKTLPMYAIRKRDSKELIFPPLSGKRLLWDMLMIIRVPNPYQESNNASITIIGGMHGYSAEAFFRDFGRNMKMLEKTVQNKKYFQLLVPAKIDKNCYTEIDWDGGRDPWTTTMVELSSNKLDYL